MKLRELLVGACIGFIIGLSCVGRSEAIDPKLLAGRHLLSNLVPYNGSGVLVTTDYVGNIVRLWDVDKEQCTEYYIRDYGSHRYLDKRVFKLPKKSKEKSK